MSADETVPGPAIAGGGDNPPAAAVRNAYENVVSFDDIAPADRMLVALDGFEGPLDLLLHLARAQKIDLAKLSILALAEQYLDYIAEARALRLEIAADYLVMAAWLAFLKSKLLLPVEEKQQDGPDGEEMALHLAFRLKRLDAMRQAAASLFNSKQLGIDFFSRGLPEGMRTIRKSDYWASVYDLLKAYADQRRKNAAAAPVKWGGRDVWSIKQARELLERLVGSDWNWAALDSYLEQFLVDPQISKTALASSFGATLELTREGYTELRQARPFAPIYIKWLKEPPADHEPHGDGSAAAEGQPVSPGH
jgi:segregation and condensation protein A